MTLLSPGLMIAVGALAIPVLIHLWQRKRSVRILFGTLRFLKIVAAKTSRLSRVENLLLLLMRTAVFALIIFAMMRPALPPENTRLLGGNVPRSVAIIVDESLSMTYRSGAEVRLDVAKQAARSVIDDLKTGDSVALFAVSDHVRPIIAEPTVDHAIARQAIESVQPTEARTDFSEALRAAGKALSKETRGVRQIFLITDNQESAWQFDRAAVFDEAWRDAKLQLIVVSPDDVKPVNAAVTKVQFNAPFAASGSMLRGVATVENRSDTPFHDMLEIRMGREKLAVRPVDAPPQSVATVPFEFQVPQVFERWLHGIAALPGDNLAGDDQYFFTLPVSQSPRVLIVEPSDGPESARSGFYLRKALGVGGQGAPVRTVTPSDLDDLAVDPFSAIFLASPANLSDRAVVRLERYLEAGGTVIFLPGDQTDTTAISRIEWMPAKPGRVTELPPGRLAAFAVEPQHPLFANSWDAGTPFPALPQRKILEWTLAPGGRVLLTLGGKFPFIIYGERGTGRVIIVNASPDRAWGDFPLTNAFLPLVQQVARLSLTRGGKALSLSIGDRVPAPPSLPRDEALSVKLPGGDVVAARPGVALLERAGSAGFYEVSSEKEGVLHEFTVNTDPREADLAPMNDEVVQRIIPHERIAGFPALQAWLAQSRGLIPLWPTLLLAALALFVAEAVYSNFLARRRSQGDDEHIKTGRLNKRRFGQRMRLEQAKPEDSHTEGAAR